MMHSRTRIRPIVYDIHDWTCVENSANTIVYRPGLLTFVRRCGYVLVAALIIGPIFLLSQRVVYHNRSARSSAEEITASPDESARIASEILDTIHEDQRKQIAEEVERHRREMEAERVQRDTERAEFGRALGLGLVAITCPIAFFAVMAPLSTLWHRVSIEPAGNQQLRIHSRGIWSSARLVSLHDFPHMAVRATETIHRARRAGLLRLGYRWKVSLEPSSLSMMGQRSAKIIEFQVHHQRNRPVDGARLPERVRQFSNALELMTGIAANEADIMDYRGATPSWFGGRRVVAGEPRQFEVHVPLGDPVVTTRTYATDEVSPEMRAQMEALMARAKESGVQYSIELRSENGAITYRDADGVEHRFASVDELPPHVRVLFEQMRTFRERNR